MIESFFIMFRETFEAALIIGIVAGFLAKTNRETLNKYIFYGILSGLIASIAGAFIFKIVAGGFEGQSEQIFEGTTMIIGAILLSTMILWMIKNSNVKNQIENKLTNPESGIKVEIFLLVFVSVLREGVESVIFLNAASFASKSGNMPGAVMGIILAAVLGYAVYKGFVKLNIRRFFTIINLLFILFAASLVSHGIGEFEESGIVPPVIEHVWGLEDESKDKENYAAKLFSDTIGFNSSPSVSQLLAYFGYISIMFILWKRMKK